MPSLAMPSAARRRLAVPGAVAAAVVAAALPLGLAGAPTRAQAEPIRLDVSMGHHALAWQGEPDASYTVRLSNPNAISDKNPDGEKAFVTAQADASGAVRTLLHFRTSILFAPIEPGDRLEVALADGPTQLDLLVPDVGADASDDGTRVAGRAAPGATVTMALEAAGDGAPAPQTVVAGADGAYALELPADRRLAEGEGGTATFLDGAGHRFTDVFARRRVELLLGSAYAEARASQQAPVEVLRPVIVSGMPFQRALGARLPTADGLPFDGRRVLVGDEELIMRAGDVVTITQSGGPLRRADAWVRTLPELAVRLEGDRVTGRAPAGAAVALEAGPADRAAVVSATVTADAAGNVGLDLPAGARIEAGWWAHARLDTGDGIWLRARTIVPRVEASVGAGHVGIDMEPLKPVTLTLTGPGGEVRYAGAHVTSATGRLDVQLRTGDWDVPTGLRTHVAMRPGDRLAVATDGDDPLVFTLPGLSARTDADAESIAGSAPANDVLQVAVVEAGATTERSVATDADGRWHLDLAGAVDLEPGVYARVDWLDRGHRFYAYTAARGIQAAVDGTSIESWPYIGYAMAITLTAPDGRLVASSTVPLNALERPDATYFNHWSAQDRFDHREVPRAGDRLTVAVGGDEATLIVPPLDLRSHVADDLVLGRTIPGGSVQLRTASYPHDGTTLAEAVADPAGVVRFELGTVKDLAYNDVLFALLALGRHRVAREITVPGLTLDLSRGLLEGVLEPHVSVSARVGLTAPPAASGRTVADRRGAISLVLAGPDGRMPDLRPGSPIALEAPEAELNARLDWAVPGVAFDDGRSEVVVGVAPAGSVVHATRRTNGFIPEVQRRNAALDVPAGADGRWTADLGQAPSPGWVTRVVVDLPDGHRAERRDVVPIVRAHLGTPEVCGVGLPRADVVVEVRSEAGALLATAQGRSDVEGRFDVQVLGPGGMPLSLASGHRVSARVGEEPMGLTLGAIESMSLADRRVSARVTPGATAWLRAPAWGCLTAPMPEALAGGRLPAARGGQFGLLRADASGLVSMPLGATRSPAYGLSVVVFTTDGQSYMRSHVPDPFGTAYADSDRVGGLASPGSTVAVQLEDAAGAVRGAAEGVAATDGRFDARLRGDDGAPVLIRPGDVVALTAEAGTARFTVEPLAFDVSPAAGLAVTAPPDRPIIVRFGIGDRIETLEARTDADGRFAFRPDEVPPRAGWTLADVTEVEVLLMQAGDHATGYAWAAEARGARTVWLPWGGR